MPTCLYIYTLKNSVAVKKGVAPMQNAPCTGVYKKVVKFKVAAKKWL